MRQGQGFLLVYSITDRSSFEEVQSFYNEVYRVKEDENRKNSKIPIMIVGNKADMGMFEERGRVDEMRGSGDLEGIYFNLFFIY